MRCDYSNRLPHLGTKGVYPKQLMQDKLFEHQQYIDQHCQALPEVRNRKWHPPDRMAPSVARVTAAA
jgi:xylulose-5-phosphate/fructose-6-phosphate phosphoketolase